MDTTLAVGLIVLAFGAGFLAGKNGTGAKSLPPVTDPDPKALEAVRPILAAEGKIAAIKAYREKSRHGSSGSQVRRRDDRVLIKGMTFPGRNAADCWRSGL